jgi:hypothetical protein
VRDSEPDPAAARITTGILAGRILPGVLRGQLRLSHNQYQAEPMETKHTHDPNLTRRFGPRFRHPAKKGTE